MMEERGAHLWGMNLPHNEIFVIGAAYDAVWTSDAETCDNRVPVAQQLASRGIHLVLWVLPRDLHPASTREQLWASIKTIRRYECAFVCVLTQSGRDVPDRDTAQHSRARAHAHETVRQEELGRGKIATRRSTREGGRSTGERADESGTNLLHCRVWVIKEVRFSVHKKLLLV
jgi:hypothetical protein